MSQPGHGVTITAEDIYRQLLVLTDKVTVSLAKLDSTERTIGDHEARIRAMERSRWPIASITVLIGLASLIVAALALAAHK